MEIIKALWIAIFFFFTLMLLFIWSKIAVITNKIKNISTLIEKSAAINLDDHSEEEDDQSDTEEQK